MVCSRFPRATVGILGAFVFASYLTVQLGPIFKLPAWAQDLSAFKLFGQPLTSGVDQTGLAIMLVIVLVGVVASAVVMERRDIGARGIADYGAPAGRRGVPLSRRRRRRRASRGRHVGPAPPLDHNRA